MGSEPHAGRRSPGISTPGFSFRGDRSQAAGEPCVTYNGPGGAGHYVKMVHNGIEYGVMQLIAET